jgi:hypothetical protein
MSTKHWICIFLLIVLAGCSRPPPLGRDLPTDYVGTNPVFDKRLKARYPIGSSVTALRGELRKEGFTIISHDFSSDYQESAEFSISDFACRDSWSVYWSADNDGKITAEKGRYRNVCL